MGKILTKDNNFRIKYSVKSVVLNRHSTKYELLESSGELIAGHNIRYMRSDATEVIIDNKDIFSISNAQRKVTRLPFQGKALGERDDIYGQLIDSSILKNFTVHSCTDVKDGNVEMVKYSLTPNNVRYSSYSSCIIYIDKNTNAFKKIEVVLNPKVESDVKSYVFTIIERNSTKTYTNVRSGREILLDANGKLKGAYSKYQYQYVN